MNVLPTLDGIVTADELTATVDAIAAIQLPDGNIPWIPGDHTDPWNLVEAAMALDIGRTSGYEPASGATARGTRTTSATR